jgi:PhzF family phenazine biosynthesis protein
VTGPAPEVPVVWVDAFTDRPFGGNPAAVCLLEHPASTDVMQAVAFELGLSETAFVWPEADGFRLRWFTPATEVDLCGHATVAAAHALRAAGRVAGTAPVGFHTRSGLVSASFDDGRIELDLPADAVTSADPPAALADRWPVTATTVGRSDLVVEVADADTVRSVVAPLEVIAALPYRGVIVTARGDPGSGTDYVLRFFAPAVGVPEDPVTGSAQCTLGPYWADRLGRTRLEAAQLSPRGGRLGVTVAGDRVGVAGTAVTVLVGALTGDAGGRLAGGTG